MDPAPKISFRNAFPNASAEGIDLLAKMFAYNPSKRISAKEALQHSYFKTDPLPCTTDELASVIQSNI